MSEEAIIAAVKAGDRAKVQALVEADPSLAQLKTSEGSLVLTALYHGAGDVVPVLLDTGLELDLFEAAAVGDPDRVSAIVASQPEAVHAVNPDGFTPLGLAAFFGQEEVAQRLLAGGADVNQVMESANRNTALDAAVASGHPEVVRILLEGDADVECRALGGYTPLLKAAFGGDIGLVRLLLDHGADPQATTDEGRMALDIAIERGFEEVAAVLREHGGPS